MAMLQIQYKRKRLTKVRALRRDVFIHLFLLGYIQAMRDKTAHSRHWKSTGHRLAVLKSINFPFLTQQYRPAYSLEYLDTRSNALLTSPCPA